MACQTLAANELKVGFGSIRDVEEFVRCIADYSGDLDLSQGRMVVDAKSILGVCSLNMGDEMELQVHGGNIDELKTKIERFLR